MPTRTGARDPQSSSLCGRYIRELGASGEALNPSLRAPIILIVGRDGGCTHTRSQGVLHFGSTSVLWQKASDGRVPAEEDVSAASQHIISVNDKPQLLQLVSYVENIACVLLSVSIACMKQSGRCSEVILCGPKTSFYSPG